MNKADLQNEAWIDWERSEAEFITFVHTGLLILSTVMLENANETSTSDVSKKCFDWLETPHYKIMFLLR